MSGCVYYNGIYNAQAAAKSADSRLRRDNETEASAQFEISAEKAESVLVRHPNSKWRARALYLAGRGAALGSQCEKGIPRIHQYLTLAGQPRDDRDRARVALASCDVRASRLAQARAILDSLIDSPNRTTAQQSRIWAARAALAMGDRDAVAVYLQTLDGNVLQWELVTASIEAREFVRAESLLILRAKQGDFREEAARSVREMASRGEWRLAEHIVNAYDRARIRDAQRANLHFLLGDYSLRVGRDSSATQHLFAARTLGSRDSVIARESSVRLALLSLPRMTALRELDSLLALQDSASLRTTFVRRVSEHALFVRMLEGKEDPTGAALFLAAEVARDSLRAPRLAQSLFLRVAREVNGSILAPFALHAAGTLVPDSLDDWHSRIIADYATSSVAARLRGEDPAGAPDYIAAAELLRFTWLESSRFWVDSVRKLRAPPPKSAFPVKR